MGGEFLDICLTSNLTLQSLDFPGSVFDSNKLDFTSQIIYILVM